MPVLVPWQLLPADVAVDVVELVGLTGSAVLVAAIAAIVYRWYARSRIPEGLAVLAGLAVVAVSLNTSAALSLVIAEKVSLLDPVVAVTNVLTFVLAAGGSVVGQRAGDRVALGLGVVTGARELEADLSRLVKSVGRLITVTLPADPDDVEDIEGYDPVPPETKAALAGKTLVFPRGLTVAALRERLVERLRDDYGVGHVDVDLAEDGTVEYLAVGSRAAGIGPTLAPGTVATAIRGDPPFSATSGDAVQVWTGGDEPTRVTSGEFRAAADDVVTLALDAVEAGQLDPERRYRLVTLPSEPRADREFASLLRGADETLGAVTVPEGSDLVGSTVGALDVAVIAVRPSGGTVETIPRRDRVLDAGDELYAVARPEALRRLEGAAAAATTAPEAEPS